MMGKCEYLITDIGMDFEDEWVKGWFTRVS